MSEYSNLLNTLFFVGCCILLFGLFFLIISIVLVKSTKARWKYAKEIHENLNDPAYVEKLLPVPRRYLSVYLVVSITFMASLLCTIGTIIAYHLDFPLIKDINPAILGNISIVVISAATIFVFGFLIFDWIRKMKK